MRPLFLGIDPKYYGNAIASDLCYVESFEYVLNLIEQLKTNRKDVQLSISNIILGETSCIEESKRLDINPTKFKKIKKLIKI